MKKEIIKLSDSKNVRRIKKLNNKIISKNENICNGFLSFFDKIEAM